MILAPLLPRLAESIRLAQTIEELLARRRPPTPLSVADIAKPALLAAIHAAVQRPVLFITARPGQARRYVDELALWSPTAETVALFPATDALPYEPLTPDPRQTAERLAVLARLMDGRSHLLVVASIRAVADRLMSPTEFASTAGWLCRGQQVSPRALMARWLSAGYEVVSVVEAPGQAAHRGGIVDVYPAGVPDGQADVAYRLEFWGDEIDSIRTFDPSSQRSTGQVEAVFVPPACEVLADSDEPAWPQSRTLAAPVPRSARLHALRGVYGSASLLDYVPADALIVLDEPRRLTSTWAELEREAEELRAELVERGELPAETPPPFYRWAELARQIEGSERPTLVLEHDPEHETLPIRHVPIFAGRLTAFLDHLAELVERQPAGGAIIVSRQTARLAELLAERGLPTSERLESAATGQERPGSQRSDGRQRGTVTLLSGTLAEGWCSEALGISLFTDGELFGARQDRRPVRAARAGTLGQALLSEISEGDLVVHVDHGIARYRGLVRLDEPRDSPPAGAGSQAGREYLLLEYADADRLYVPVDQADRISRYLGGGEAPPALTRLGSGDWQRAKQRARRAVREMARELLELYAARQTTTGYAFPPDNAWLRELEASFPYVETNDQMVAIEDVKRDMEQPRPMDRLLVGDVGFGKTEVALRAAFKAVLGGKQVAVLVPTTVLAQQHYHTFRQRLEAFPVRVEMLSRFRSEREQRAVVEGLANGTIDICIGTHRLVQKDVRFKDLGLVIIDEEQRFGVADKERLKQLRHEVDVLTLTATPIPRTLHMALSGVRDMSVIATAPINRVPIRTYLGEFDESVVREAIVREIERGGQVYFVHDRVQGIEQVANRLRRLVPEARVAVGHGQMPEDQLEQTMLDFAEGGADVLVCTTIIESGLDLPNVNTIIVNNAHRFGLAQLYQLRGRVGRSAARAYAYFLYSRASALTEAAEQRLRTIFEATELGAGFRIAMKDLEIRGAGNLLGAEQSGHISAIGFDLYTRLLSEAVEALKAARAGQRVTVEVAAAQPSLSLPLDAYLPESYVVDEQLRLNLYQRLAAAHDGPTLGALIEELEDRFGPLPEPAQNLAYLLSLRLTARQAGVEEIAVQSGRVIVRFRHLPRLDVAALSRQLGVGLELGSNQIRFPLDGSQWMPRLVTLLEAAAASDQVGATGRLRQAMLAHAGKH